MFKGNHGALGTTFLFTRLLQALSMIAMIGMTANFVSEIITTNLSPPPVLLGTLSIICIAVLYSAITTILYLDSLLPYLISSVIDTLFLVALIVVSVVVGKPLSYLDCIVIGDMNSSAAGGAYSFAAALDSSITQHDGLIVYSSWIGTSRSTCLEMKSIWGLSIALCILFTLSAISTLCLWRRNKQSAPEKGEA